MTTTPQGINSQEEDSIWYSQSQELAGKLWNLEVGVIKKIHGEKIITYLDTNTQNTIFELIEAEASRRERAADTKTLETIAALLNGDYNQVEVVRGYIRNKLQMHKENINE